MDPTACFIKTLHAWSESGTSPRLYPGEYESSWTWLSMSMSLRQERRGSCTGYERERFMKRGLPTWWGPCVRSVPSWNGTILKFGNPVRTVRLYAYFDLSCMIIDEKGWLITALICLTLINLAVLRCCSIRKSPITALFSRALYVHPPIPCGFHGSHGMSAEWVTKKTTKTILRFPHQCGMQNLRGFLTHSAWIPHGFQGIWFCIEYFTLASPFNRDSTQIPRLAREWQGYEEPLTLCQGFRKGEGRGLCFYTLTHPSLHMFTLHTLHTPEIICLPIWYYDSNSRKINSLFHWYYSMMSNATSTKEARKRKATSRLDESDEVLAKKFKEAQDRRSHVHLTSETRTDMSQASTAPSTQPTTPQASSMSTNTIDDIEIIQPPPQTNNVKTYKWTNCRCLD